MTRLDPIIAVRDVSQSAKWYQQVFGFTDAHGDDDFAVLMSDDNEIVLCLHKWEAHHHPSLTDQKIPAGNGLLLYFRTDKMETIRKNIYELFVTITEDVHVNPNSLRKEFSFKDPDGYYLTVTEYHKYEG